ncbi:hypothetical protein BBI17_006189 [Phytophthora kernoviae]|uniref:Uncharacterized protein n=2 Tax=Phytophthora kernoviae TaxID=325452 RepID=A0A3R7J0K1_9STRA|nr:hypothetical protein G195_002961 [Phytophthora kernoviae 00238/432]KAG2526284.1 hypothetical protein JM16_002070 [Phytophthora kernoviae]RLN02255.1 hypothetical protein BBI17_006189 [Phytophthora kernoviae]
MLSLKQTPEPAKVFLQIRRILAILTLTLMLHPKAEQAQKLGSQVSPMTQMSLAIPTTLLTRRSYRIQTVPDSESWGSWVHLLLEGGSMAWVLALAPVLAQVLTLA